MTTFHITAKTPEALKFIEFARTLPFVEEKKTKKTTTPSPDSSLDRIPGLPYTREECIASAMQGLEDYHAGRVISHEDMGRLIDTW